MDEGLGEGEILFNMCRLLGTQIDTPLSYAARPTFKVSTPLERIKFFLHIDLCQRYIVRKASNHD